LVLVLVLVFLALKDLLDLRDLWVYRVFLDPRVLRGRWAHRDLLVLME
jgi:hypothetical protein